MNEGKSRTVFEERDRLRQERNRQEEQFKWLEGQIETALGLLGEEHAENVRLCAELEAIRKERDDWRTEARARAVTIAELEAALNVADAAVAVEIANHDILKIKDLPDYKERWGRYQDAIRRLAHVQQAARDALNAAVREYRKLMEGQHDR